MTCNSLDSCLQKPMVKGRSALECTEIERLPSTCNVTLSMQDNHLNVGDVCVFELISSKETTLRVATFRNMNDRGEIVIVSGFG